MKTIKASLLMSLLTMSISLILSGCYTQLAFVNDEQASTTELSPIIIYQPEIVPVYVPVYDPPPAPVYSPLPSAGSSSDRSVQQPPSRPRDTGYQRSGETQTTNSGSDIRTSGSKHSGR
jgi:hypothetical protein